MADKKGVKKGTYLQLIVFVFLFIWVMFWLYFALFSGDKGEKAEHLFNALPEIAFLGIILLAIKFRKIGSLLLIGSGVFAFFFFNAMENYFVLSALALPPFIAGIILFLNALKTKSS